MRESAEIQEEDDEYDYSVRLNLRARLPLIAAAGLYTLFCIPAALNCGYWTMKTWRRKTEFGFAGRKIDLLMVIVFAYYNFLLATIVDTWLSAFQMHEKRGYVAITLNSLNTVGFVTAYTTGLGFFCLRFWLIYFDCSLAAANADNQWVTLITKDLSWLPRLRISKIDDMSWDDIQSFLEMVRTTSSLLSISKSNSLSPWRFEGNFSVHSRHKSNLGGIIMPGMSVNYESAEVSAVAAGAVSTLRDPAPQSSGLPSSIATIMSSQWFYDHKNSYGNPRWLRCRMFVMLPWIIAVVSVPLCFQSPLYFYLGRALFGCVLASALFFCWKVRLSFPVYADSIRLTHEVDLIMAVAVCAVVTYAVSLGGEIYLVSGFKKFGSVTENEWRDQMILSFWIVLGSNWILACLGSALVIIPTRWVCLTFVRDGPVFDKSDKNSVEIVDVGLTTALFNIPPPKSPEKRKEERNTRVMSELDMIPVKVEQILADEMGFHLFIGHLFKEFSYECLLCVMEVQQFRTMLLTEERERLMKLEEMQQGSNANETCNDSSNVSTKNTVKDATTKDANNTSDDFVCDNTMPNQGDHPSEIYPQLSTIHSGVSFVSKLSKKISSIPGMITPRSTSDAGFMNATSMDDDPNQNRIQFPSSIKSIKSSIVWHSKLSNEQKFCVLCKKYFLHRSEMTVNISHNARDKLIRIYDLLTKGFIPAHINSEQSFQRHKRELMITFRVFDEAILEMVRLMRDSLSRFRLIPEYPELKQRIQMDPLRIQRSVPGSPKITEEP